MCPAVYDLDDNIRHDLVRKIGVKKAQNNLKQGGKTTATQSPCNVQFGSFLQTRTIQELPILSSSHSILNLSILSSVRLIL
jgi:hypothetical protein